MSDNPLDRIPAFDRVSLRAVMVPEGADPGPALAAAGIVDPIALPIVFGEDPPDRSFGDGFTPNVKAVLEYDQPQVFDSDFASGNRLPTADTLASSAGTQFRAPESAADDEPPSRSATVNLPATYGMQSLAPVRPYDSTQRNANRAKGTPPNPYAFPGTWGSSPASQPAPAQSTTNEAPSSEPVNAAMTPALGMRPPTPDLRSGPSEETAHAAYAPRREPTPASAPEVAQTRDDAPSLAADVAAPTSEATALVPFVDDKGSIT
jgi:hypothetical protein